MHVLICVHLHRCILKILGESSQHSPVFFCIRQHAEHVLKSMCTNVFTEAMTDLAVVSCARLSDSAVCMALWFSYDSLSMNGHSQKSESAKTLIVKRRDIEKIRWSSEFPADRSKTGKNINSQKKES